MTAPLGSVIEMIVLLNVLLMRMTVRDVLFFLTAHFLAPGVLGGMCAFFSYDSATSPTTTWPSFLACHRLARALRVRALVCVRCPRTGRPRR